MKAVILAGGFGKRLKPLTDTRPKPMIKIIDKPIIEWQITWLRRFGIEEFVLCVGYMRELIVNHVGDGSKFDSKVEYSYEEKPLGTGGALLNAKKFISEEESFFLLNGDILTHLDPTRLKNRGSNTIALVPLHSPFGIVEVDNDTSRVLRFVEKPEIPNSWINAGVYHFTKDVFEYLPQQGNIEVTALPTLAKQGALIAVKYTDLFWHSIDSHKDIEEASKGIQETKLS
jgi:mannose-1-phosphate guanylyltransferase